MTVNTLDREDHTFCGIMFPVECKEVLPVERLIITSVSVRGRLGPLSVYMSKDPEDDNDDDHARRNNNDHDDARKRRRGDPNRGRRGRNRITADEAGWVRIYSETHAPSFSDYDKLDLSKRPIVVEPGRVRGVYVHSTQPGDEAIVYDDYRGREEGVAGGGGGEIPEDDFLVLRPAMAHVSEKPFGMTPIWGWGDAWRRDRKFVGRLEYGVVYRLWNPRVHADFGDRFRATVKTLLACQRRSESPFSLLPDECIFYILNMCKWDWMGDDVRGMKRILKKKKEKRKLLEKQQRKKERKAVAAAALAATAAREEVNDNEDEVEGASGDEKPLSAENTCARTSCSNGEEKEDNDDDVNDNDEEWEETNEDDEWGETKRMRSGRTRTRRMKTSMPTLVNTTTWEREPFSTTKKRTRTIVGTTCGR